MNIIDIIIAASLAIFGIIIFAGKGDKFIAGYNTASQQEKEQYNVSRLRILIGTLLLWIALMSILSIYLHLPKEISMAIKTAAIIIPTIIVLILANTWAKRRYK